MVCLHSFYTPCHLLQSLEVALLQGVQTFSHLFRREVPPPQGQQPLDCLLVIPLSDGPCPARRHDGIGLHIPSDHCPGADDGAVPRCERRRG